MSQLGARIIVLHHPQWQGGDFTCYEGTVVPNFRSDWLGLCFIAVRFPWLKRTVYLPPECVCPVYNNCEICGYAAWGAIDYGSFKRDPDWHHFCAWHLPAARELWQSSQQPYNLTTHKLRGVLGMKSSGE